MKREEKQEGKRGEKEEEEEEEKETLHDTEFKSISVGNQFSGSCSKAKSLRGRDVIHKSMEVKGNNYFVKEKNEFDFEDVLLMKRILKILKC